MNLIFLDKNSLMNNSFDLNLIKKILIIRLSSLGDIILTTPVIRSLKENYPHLVIDILLKQQYSDVYKFNPYISDVILYKKDLVLSEYDLIIDLQNNFRSGVAIKKLSSPVVKFNKRGIDKFLLVHFKINRLKDAPLIPVRYANIIPGFELDNQGTDLFLGDIYEPGLDRRENYIGICPGSRHFTKRWPGDFFTELSNNLIKSGFKIALFGGKTDRQTCKRISEKVPGSIDLSNDDNLLKTATDLKCCTAVVCNDSGLMHAHVQ